MLQKRIERITEYFKGIEMSGGLFIVKVQYKHGWNAYPTSDGETIKVARSDQEADVWFYYSDASKVDLEMIFDLIEETIEMNESVRKKIELLKIKVEELKTLFNDESLARLETLQFVFAEEKKKNKRPTSRKNKQKIVVNSENVELENTTEEISQ